MLNDLIQKIIIILSLEYLIFFSAEVILPGVITSAFNINILLLSSLSLVGLLILLPRNRGDKGSEADGQQKTKSYNRQFLLLGVVLLLINIISLYKVSIAMMAIYTGIVMVSVKLLWNNNSSN